MAVQREMIHRTIKEHLEKEKRLAPRGVKVLSLFFIDAVEKYRQYDAEGNSVKGVYARIFEEEYRRLARHPDYQSLFKEVDLTTAAEDVHKGYFSIDRKKVGTKTVEVFKDTRGDSKADDDTYNLIMRDKETLLSFSTPLKFIFSHSALREGWDNPNVFQICALREMGSEQQRRQTIGRGLRLCVNQDGERLRGFEVNTLTVIATESFEMFAEKLQKEIEDETGIRFGIVEAHQFAGVTTTGADGQAAPLGFDQSKVLWEHLRAAGLVNAQGKVHDTLRQQLKDDTLTLPEPFAAQVAQVKAILRKLAGRLEIKNADERRQVKTRQAVLQGDDFKALWERIKYKTTYRVQFDNEAMLATCIEALKGGPPVAKTRLHWRKADLAIGRSGVDATQTVTSAPVTLDESDIELPDILTDLQDKTQLTRRSIYRILVESSRLDDFKRNPQQFIELATEIINRSKRLALVDGIKYQRIGAEGLLRPATVRDRRVGRLPQVHDRREPVGLRAGDLPVGTGAHLRRAVGEERGDQGVRQASWLVPSPDAPRPLQPRLGGAGGKRRSRAPLLRGRNKEQPVHRRPPRQGERQDQVRRGPLQGAQSERVASRVRRGEFVGRRPGSSPVEDTRELGEMTKAVT